MVCMDDSKLPKLNILRKIEVRKTSRRSANETVQGLLEGHSQTV